MAAYVPLSMWVCPGPNAVPTIEMDADGNRYLSLYFDPFVLALTVPPFPNGPMVLALFYRRLARLAAQLAAELDPGDAEIVRGVPGKPGLAGGLHRRSEGGGPG
jgi:hypothetical protein